jgi:prophage antirepressor-like protein
MYKLILSSNSTISKSFKTDIANILVSLRKQGTLEIANNKLAIKKSSNKHMIPNGSDLKANTNIRLYRYDSM